MKTITKKNIILLTLLLFTTYQKIDLAQGYWERIDSPTDNYLRSVHFVDSLYGWAVGDSGIIIHSSDAGANWAIQNSETENNIYDVFFLNRNLGWASSWKVLAAPFGTELLRTTDGGQNWISPTHPEYQIFSQCVLFLDSLNGWMGGNPQPIVRTTDGGLTWREPVIDTSNFANLPVYDIQFYDSAYGYASGGVIDCCGIMWWTTDGGDYWYVLDTPYVAPEPIYQIYLYDSLNVLGVGGDFESIGLGVGMIRSSNGGVSWGFEYIGISGVAWDIDFRTAYEAWSPLGGQEKLIYSLDSGFTWNAIPTPENTIIYDIIFPDSLHGFAVGRDGAILKYKPSVVNSIDNNENYVQKEFNLQQNYPNPFNPSTKISYSIPEDGFVKLNVYNLLGEEIALLVNEQKVAGSYELEFNAENLSSGIYIYSLSTSSYKSSRKMIVIR